MLSWSMWEESAETHQRCDLLLQERHMLSNFFTERGTQWIWEVSESDSSWIGCSKFKSQSKLSVKKLQSYSRPGFINNTENRKFYNTVLHNKRIYHVLKVSAFPCLTSHSWGINTMQSFFRQLLGTPLNMQYLLQSALFISVLLQFD